MQLFTCGLGSACPNILRDEETALGRCWRLARNARCVAAIAYAAEGSARECGHLAVSDLPPSIRDQVVTIDLRPLSGDPEGGRHA